MAISPFLKSALYPHMAKGTSIPATAFGAARMGKMFSLLLQLLSTTTHSFKDHWLWAGSIEPVATAKSMGDFSLSSLRFPDFALRAY